jgi:hypothetical protein
MVTVDEIRQELATPEWGWLSSEMRARILAIAEKKE